MRWIAVLVLAAACAASSEVGVKYTATYANVGSVTLARLALVATANQGYEIATQQTRKHDFAFLTLPSRLEQTDVVDVAFMVQIVYEYQATHRKRFYVLVEPRAYVNDIEVAKERLPPTATSRTKQLSDAIRASSRQHEAPAI